MFPKQIFLLFALSLILCSCNLELDKDQKEPEPRGFPNPKYQTQNVALEGKLLSANIPLAKLNESCDDCEYFVSGSYVALENADGEGALLDILSYLHEDSSSKSPMTCHTKIPLSSIQVDELNQIFSSLYFCQHELISPESELPACVGIVGPGYFTEISIRGDLNSMENHLIHDRFQNTCVPSKFISYCHPQQADLLSKWARNLLTQENSGARNCEANK